MKIFRGYRQDLNFLLPPSLDEFVPEDHEVRIINADAYSSGARFPRAP
jgi:transposase